MSLVDRLKKATEERKTAIMLYSAPGLGKTSLAAEFPKVLFLADGLDRGVEDLIDSGLVRKDLPMLQPPQNYNELLAHLTFLAEEPGLEKEVNWVVIDGLSGVEEHAHKHWADTKYGGDRDKFLDWSKGPKAASAAFREITQKLDKIRERGIGVIILAHAGTKEATNALGNDYAKIAPLCNKHTFEVFQQWAPNLGYIEQVVTTREDESENLKADAVDIRQIRFTPVPACEAKNRWGIDKPVPMGRDSRTAFVNLMAAIMEAKAKNPHSPKKDKKGEAA